MAPGQYVDYTFTVQNNMPGTEVYDLTTSSTLGFPADIYDQYGNPLSSVSLGAGASTTVVVRVTVPAGATLGTQDVMRLTATSHDDPYLYSSATGTTTVASGIAIDPNNTGYGGAGAWMQYTHTITNSWPSDRTVALSALSSQGWLVKIYDSGGVTEVTSINVGPNGDTEDVIVRVYVPPGVAEGTIDVTTITASAPGSPPDTATDTTTVRRLLTYADAGFINDEDQFLIGDTVFARATGLTPKSDVYYVWIDANGTVVRTSATLKVDTQGMVFDDYPTLETDPTGSWTVQLYTSGGTLLESYPFTVGFDAEISALSATNAPQVNTPVTVSSSVTNDNSVTITNSQATYLIWWDSNGNGTFNAGDLYIDAAGTPRTWDGTTAIAYTYTNTDIADVPGGGTVTCPSWQVSNINFPNQGTYNVTMTWTESDGTYIDDLTTQFYSVPTLGWPLLTLALAGTGLLVARRRSRLARGPKGAVT